MLRTVSFAAAALCFALPALAAPLVIYSPQGGDRGQWIADQARAAGHDVSILNAGGGELFDRLLAERNNPQADIVMGLVDGSMALLKKEGLFAAYSPAWAADLPEQFNDPDAMVHKFWQTPIVISYNSDALSADDAPKSWLDLAKPEYQGKYTIGDLAWQTTRVYLAGMLVRFADENGTISDEGWQFMRDFFANGVEIRDDEGKTQAFRNEGAVIDLNWMGGAFRHAAAMDYTPVIVDTEGGTPVIAEGIAIMAGSKQQDAAQAFVDWWGSEETMTAYANQFNQIPALPAALAASPAEVQAQANMVHPQPIDWDIVAPQLDGWLQTIELDIR
ncbi:extracellular solute-binding protein [Paracoccus sp. (in: a-proteobacteria)]|uniref:extracellular solute-binding protein n=1 Tax=Paracoccus sp. TaxID=267 RepID=UPI0026E0B5A4|nr:extracellular solute-binding protein [Paracoccus sp. (in: a-proteobacteria)]MDO5648801.1 extracellular solute-binding protein [Paracoccus sp. (in: a-proteobacteria)]